MLSSLGFSCEYKVSSSYVDISLRGVHNRFYLFGGKEEVEARAKELIAEMSGNEEEEEETSTLPVILTLAGLGAAAIFLFLPRRKRK